MGSRPGMSNGIPRPITCAWCGNQHVTLNYYRQRFCSNRCGALAQYAGRPAKAPKTAPSAARPPKTRETMPYLEDRDPGHPLARRNGKITVHRKVLYAKIGCGPQHCHWCQTLLTWAGDQGEKLVADHVDEDKWNNDPENLVPSCLRCNARRFSSSQFGAEFEKFCPKGHELIPENRRRNSDSGSAFRCRKCSLDTERERRKRLGVKCDGCGLRVSALASGVMPVHGPIRHGVRTRCAYSGLTAAVASLGLARIEQLGRAAA